MSDRNDSRIEPERLSAANDAAHPQIDRIDLFKSDSSRSALAPATKPGSEPGVLDFSQNDPLSGSGANGLEKKGPRPESTTTAGRPGQPDIEQALNRDDSGDGTFDTTRKTKTKAKGEVRHGGTEGERKPPQERKAEVPPQPADTAKTEPFQIQGDPTKFDQSRPTVAFVDYFKNTSSPSLEFDKRTNSLVIGQKIELPVNRVSGVTEKGVRTDTETGFTHGEFSARMAEKNGFNTLRVEPNSSAYGFAQTLNGMADMIDAGKLQLGKGDVINASVGNPDLTFDQLNFLLGSNADNKITPENIKNPDMQKDVLKRLGGVASDNGKSEVIRNWAQNALETNKSIERLKGMGVEVWHAAANEGPNTVGVEFLLANKELSSVDPTTGKPDKFTTSHAGITPGNGVLPIRFQPGTEQGGRREGRYTVDGTGITFSGSEFGNLNTQQTVSISGEAVPREDEALQRVFQEKLGRNAPPRITDDGYLVAVASGNSFVNVEHLAAQRERLTAMKRANIANLP